jgi:photosystem II stability/assembly factor-like uncharacterized protein
MKNRIFLILLLVQCSALTLFSQNLWNPQTSSTANHLYGVYFFDRYNGWAVGDNGTIIHTSNGGSTWGAQTSGTTVPLNGVCFVTKNKGWIVGNQGKILYTVNGGST